MSFAWLCKIIGHRWRRYSKRTVCRRCGKFVVNMGKIPKRPSW